MVAARYAYSKGRTLARRISAAFAVTFGLFMLLFAVTPKLWGERNSDSLFSFSNLFAQNIAHADVPHTGGADGGDSGDAAGDCGSDSGCGP